MIQCMAHNALAQFCKIELKQCEWVLEMEVLVLSILLELPGREDLALSPCILICFEPYTIQALCSWPSSSIARLVICCKQSQRSLSEVTFPAYSGPPKSL
ncbi:hypothetical protein L218DRAFT_580787 [Marasmius fiardii PR-910]|nr:hypothetical protein L218DRAFT_580787 [Marasmius fiardii PR-910]